LSGPPNGAAIDRRYGLRAYAARVRTVALNHLASR
jgi:hypothetical protein